MTNATMIKPAATTNETATANNNDLKVVIYPDGDFTNYNYVTPEQLESYLELFYNS